MPESASVSHRVATLLELVAFHEGGIGVREAARETGIDRSAVSRLFRQLEAVGWVEELEGRGLYTVGPRMFAVAAAARQRDSLWRVAGPVLRELRDEFDETAYIAVREGDRVVFREKLESSQRIRYVVELHAPHRLTTGAAGRAILSGLAEPDVTRILGEGLVAHTPQSITDADAYRAQLEADRRLGYAYSASGWVARGGGVASPFFDAAGQCAGAITVSAPIDRLGEDVATRIGRGVRRSANLVSARLGWNRMWGPEPD
jgi:DNA-binding IclR family transcriptional regulator